MADPNADIADSTSPLFRCAKALENSRSHSFCFDWSRIQAPRRRLRILSLGALIQVQVSGRLCVGKQRLIDWAEKPPGTGYGPRGGFQIVAAVARLAQSLVQIAPNPPSPRYLKSARGLNRH